MSVVELEPKYQAQPEVLYNLDDNPGPARATVYALQWLAFALANAAIIPVIVGSSLGLDTAGISGLVQRTFFFSALASILQVLFGHRYPILEGPAGMWYGVFISLAVLAPEMGKPLGILRTDLEMGLLVGGLLSIFLGVTRLMGKVVAFFTPIVNGTFLVLLALQLSSSIIPGMVGIWGGNLIATWQSILLSCLTIGVIIWVSLSWPGFWRSIGVLVGTVAGWIVAGFLGLAQFPRLTGPGWVSLPEVFAWGTPTWDPGIILTAVLTAIIVLSNLIASIMGMGNLAGRVAVAKDYDRGVIFTGISDLLAGVGSAIGFIPYASAIGFAALSGVVSRIPFILGAVFLAILGFITPVGAFFAAIPPPVGYAVLMATFCQVIGSGLKDYLKMPLDSRDVFVIGISLVTGTGIMFVPATAWQTMPVSLRYLLGNGLIVGMIVCLLLEHIFLRRTK